MIRKTCPTCETEFDARRNSTQYCSKTCAQHNPTVIERMRVSQKKVYDEKYGGKHPMQTKATVEKFKRSMRTIHGDDWYKTTHVEKTKKTKLSRYGDENYNNAASMKQTCLDRYGVDNARKISSVVDRVNKTVMDNHYKFLLALSKKNNIRLLFSRDEYVGYHFSNKYKFECVTCKNQFESTVFKLSNICCNKCFPDKRLGLEKSFFDFLVGTVPPAVEIKRHDRTVLVGKELDFYIPMKKMAFEVDGIYWHSEVGGNINRRYHLNKTNNCLFHGVRLFHIFETEWYEKADIVKSVIRSAFGYQKEKIYARNCVIKHVNNSEKNTFLNATHLQGEDKSTIKLGLYYKKELVSIMTFRKTGRFDKSVDWELSRFASKLDVVVVGGASKLFSRFVKEFQPKRIVSYSDRRYFSGDLYSTLGFQFVSNTPPNYFYITDDYKGLKNRMSFQKHKLKKLLPVFNPSKSEWENMKNNGFDRIWDCGHSKWIYTNK